MVSHVLIPKFYCKPGGGAKVLSALKPMYTQTSSETANSTFFPFTAEDSPDTVFLIEEYTSRAECEGTHMSSSTFKEFAGAVLGDKTLLDTESSLGHYTPVKGFLTRPGVSEYPAGKFIWLAELTCKDEAAREEVLKVFSPLADYVEKNEQNTFAYMFLKSDDDPAKLAVFELYNEKRDLFEVHHKSAEFAKFGAAVKNGGFVIDKTSTGYLTTGEGWLAKGGVGERR